MPRRTSAHGTPNTDFSPDRETQPIAAFVRKRRTANGLTQRELAELAGVGPRAVWDLERGKPTVDVASFRAALGPDVALACAMRANNETGVVLPVPELAAAAREASVPFLCDAVQAVGKIAVDVRTLGADLVLATGQKLGGPRGAGLLWIAPGLRLAPLFGGEQERGRRAGTENLPGSAGLGAALEAAAA